MSATIGKYSITYTSGNCWTITWLEADGSRRSVLLDHMEERISNLVETAEYDKQEFTQLFTCAAIDSPDIFIQNYPTFMDYVPNEVTKVDYLNETSKEKFDRFLDAFLTGYNNFRNLQLTHQDVEPYLTKLRKKLHG